MKRVLPACFRVNSTLPNTEDFCKRIRRPPLQPEDLSAEEVKVLEDAAGMPLTELNKVSAVEWMPTPTFTTKLSKQIIKKNKALGKFHKLLAEATDSGVITRQELVSTLPPLFLDVRPDHLVLDLCAAPGSKTSQILEKMSAEHGPGLYRGAVVANDLDRQRAIMLTHQLLRSSTLGMAVVNHEAQNFPKVPLPDSHEGVRFDRVLADVPCSGDGATRKLPNKWFDWKTEDGLTLHPLQLSILKKAVHCCKPGGRVLYSTCSLNPIEDEAVVHALLKQVRKGSLRLLDIHGKMPGLVAQRGLVSWQVAASIACHKGSRSEVDQFSSLTFEELFHVYQPDDELTVKKVKRTMFPPKTDDPDHSLRHTMRVLPSDMDCGGFFLALIEKTD